MTMTDVCKLLGNGVKLQEKWFSAEHTFSEEGTLYLNGVVYTIILPGVSINSN